MDQKNKNEKSERSRWSTSSNDLSSVQSLSHVQLFVTPWTAAYQVSLSFTISRFCPNSCPLSWWCHQTISFSVTPFSCLQSFWASGSFLISQFFASGGQNIGTSAWASVLPINIQGWFPLRLTCFISLLLRDSQEFSLAPEFKSINSSTLSLL